MKKSFFEFVKLTAIRYTVLLTLLSILFSAVSFLEYPSFFHSKGTGVIKRVTKSVEFVSGKRSGTRFEFYLIEISNHPRAFKCSECDLIDSFGIENVIGREAMFRYSESKVVGNWIEQYLYVDDQKVFHQEDNLLLFFSSLALSLLCAWGAIYGIKADYLKRNPSRK